MALVDMVRVTRAVAFDPGPHDFGWAIAETGRDARGLVRFVAGGKALRKPEIIFGILQDAGADAIVAVESPSGYVQTNRGPGVILATAKQLVSTSGCAGEIRGIAWARGHRVFPLSAEEVRRAICGKPNANDAEIKAAVQRFTVNLPAKTSEHVRDAHAIATVALWNPRAAKGAA